MRNSIAIGESDFGADFSSSPLPRERRLDLLMLLPLEMNGRFDKTGRAAIMNKKHSVVFQKVRFQ